MEDRFFKVKTYNYDLPEKLIAQNPVEPRDSSRLLVLHKNGDDIEHRHFKDIIDYLRPGDVLIRNNTKVMAARLIGKKIGGSAEAELLILAPLGENTWEAMVRPGRRLKPGAKVALKDGTIATVEDFRPEGLRSISFPKDTDVPDLLERVGSMPLPPYITESQAPDSSYQTVFAKEAGSAAAPTAGLHFTEQLLNKLEKKGVIVKDVTLNVGLGTFRPVKEEDLREHPMHRESCSISEETAEAVNKAKKEGRRVVALGTTSVRTLESMAKTGCLKSGETSTNLFIYPGYEFQIVDSIITNFHLPQSTLLMLISAFAGHDKTMNAYVKAVEMEYRFFSFGDAMFID